MDKYRYGLNWLYAINNDNKYRYILGNLFNEGSNILVCFGVNPSTASPEKLDNTVNTVSRVAKINNYDGWIMFNIYPQRATIPDNMEEEINEIEHQNNLKIIKEILTTYNIKDVWFAYGNIIEKRKYLLNCLKEINIILKELKIIPFTFTPLTNLGHPRHPLYIPFEVFRLENKKHCFKL
ncbi:MAG: DUF1643 domain-containing protein [Bacillales bacterium]|nr:DUF1643 domain-containing protein [Bacillales bacterium]